MVMSGAINVTNKRYGVTPPLTVVKCAFIYTNG